MKPSPFGRNDAGTSNGNSQRRERFLYGVSIILDCFAKKLHEPGFDEEKPRNAVIFICSRTSARIQSRTCSWLRMHRTKLKQYSTSRSENGRRRDIMYSTRTRPRRA